MIAQLAGLLLRRLRRRSEPADEARRLRDRLQRMGALWVKVGQLLSLRIDLFSAAFCDELSKLQYRAEGFPPADAMAAILAATGRPLDDVFERIEAEPFAAASIAQVHRARLWRDHKEVAIKVRRPGIDDAFRKDMAVIRLLVRVLELFRFHPQLRLREGLWELERIMEEELDYRIEAANLSRFRKSMRARNAFSPKPYTDHSNAAVLVMEFIPGVLMSEMIAMTRRDPARAQAWQTQNGVKPKAVARRLYFLMLRQIIDDNLFHADMHPGNIMILRGGRIALIDFGSVGTLDRRFIDLYASSLQALAGRDYGLAVRLTLKMCEPLPPIDVDEVTRQMMRAYRAWDARAAIKQASYHERSLSSVENDVAQVLFKNGVASDWALLRMSRTWATLDSTLAFLMPNANYLGLLQRFFVERSRAGSAHPSLSDLCAPLAACGEEASSEVENYELLFEQAATKWHLLCASFLRLLAFLLFLAGVIAVVVHLQTFRQMAVPLSPGSPAADLLAAFPKLPLGQLIVASVALLFGIRTCLSHARRFAQKNPPATARAP